MGPLPLQDLVGPSCEREEGVRERPQQGAQPPERRAFDFGRFRQLPRPAGDPVQRPEVLFPQEREAAIDILDAYATNYLREEIQQEALVRRLDWPSGSMGSGQ